MSYSSSSSSSSSPSPSDFPSLVQRLQADRSRVHSLLSSFSSPSSSNSTSPQSHQEKLRSLMEASLSEFTSVTELLMKCKYDTMMKNGNHNQNNNNGNNHQYNNNYPNNSSLFPPSSSTPGQSPFLSFHDDSSMGPSTTPHDHQMSSSSSYPYDANPMAMNMSMSDNDDFHSNQNNSNGHGNTWGTESMLRDQSSYPSSSFPSMMSSHLPSSTHLVTPSPSLPKPPQTVPHRYPKNDIWYHSTSSPLPPHSPCVALIDANSQPKLWCFCRVVRYIPGNRPKYDVIDAENYNDNNVNYSNVNDIGNQAKSYTLDLAKLIPLPSLSTFPLSKRHEFTVGEMVLAWFPDTTTFYKAIVMSKRKKKDNFYELQFDDDDVDRRKIDIDKVVPYPQEWDLMGLD